MQNIYIRCGCHWTAKIKREAVPAMTALKSVPFSTVQVPHIFLVSHSTSLHLLCLSLSSPLPQFCLSDSLEKVKNAAAYEFMFIHVLTGQNFGTERSFWKVCCYNIELWPLCLHKIWTLPCCHVLGNCIIRKHMGIVGKNWHEQMRLY